MSFMLHYLHQSISRFSRSRCIKTTVGILALGSVRMMPGHRRCRLLSTVVAAEAIVGGDLVEAQHAAHGEVIFKMRVAKLALQPAKLGEHTVQARIIDTAAGESPVKFTLL